MSDAVFYFLKKLNFFFLFVDIGASGAIADDPFFRNSFIVIAAHKIGERWNQCIFNVASSAAIEIWGDMFRVNSTWNVYVS